MAQIKVSDKKKIKHDALLAIICVGVALIVWLIIHFTAQSGTNAVITVDGKLWGTFPLDEEKTVIVQNDYGTNVIEIKNGTANVISADCPDKICVNTHSISKSGETITCLPHRLVVTIDGDADDSVDFVE